MELEIDPFEVAKAVARDNANNGLSRHLLSEGNTLYSKHKDFPNFITCIRPDAPNITLLGHWENKMFVEIACVYKSTHKVQKIAQEKKNF